jgi:hypothetical protein
MIRRTYRKTVMKYIVFLICKRFSGRKSIRLNIMILRPMNANAISVAEPPYCLKILSGMRRMYKKKAHNNPRIMYP